MKAVLEYNLPDEQIEFELVYNGIRYLAALKNFSFYLRKHIKYNPSKNKYRNETFLEVQKEFFDILSEQEITLD